MNKAFFIPSVSFLILMVATTGLACNLASPLPSTAAPVEPAQTTSSIIAPTETAAVSSTPAAARPVVPPGDHQQTFNTGGIDRHWILYVPKGYNGSTALPLVFVLHGLGGNAKGMEPMTGFSDKADKEHFFVAYLNGTGDPQAWNSTLAPDMDPHVDDVAFVRALVTEIEGHLNVDTKRIYVAGFSNGAAMSYKLGAEMSDVLAGIAVVEGTIGTNQPDGSVLKLQEPIGPISLIVFHGKKDSNLPYNGGHQAGSLDTLSVADAMTFWITADKCPGTPIEKTSSDGKTVTDDYISCADGSEVIFYTLANGQHQWPKPDNGGAVPATDLIWDFFSHHSMP